MGKPIRKALSDGEIEGFASDIRGMVESELWSRFRIECDDPQADRIWDEVSDAIYRNLKSGGETP